MNDRKSARGTKNTRRVKAMLNHLWGCRWDARNGSVLVACLTIRFEADTSVGRSHREEKRGAECSSTEKKLFEIIHDLVASNISPQPRISSFDSAKGAKAPCFVAVEINYLHFYIQYFQENLVYANKEINHRFIYLFA